MIKYWLLVGDKKFSYDTPEQLNAAINARFEPDQGHLFTIIKGEELTTKTLQTTVTQTIPVTRMEVVE